MTRYPDWEARLAAYLEPFFATPFSWGEHDCCTFVFGAVMAMTGCDDPMAAFRGHYTTKRGSATALGRYGKGNLADTVSDTFEKVPVALAHRGDIVLTEFGLGIAFGLTSIHVGQEDERAGLIQRPRSTWTKAWCVPMPGAA